MRNRKHRVQLIIELIKNHCIGSQEELAQILADRGYKVTQATLSRDLKMLKTTKVPTDHGTYMYILPGSNSVNDSMLAAGRPPVPVNLHSGFISIRFSKNIAVIKTRNGYAAGLAYDIDMSRAPEILGTIPGSDTIFAVIKDGVSHEEAREIFARFLPLDDKIPIIK